MDMQIEPEGLIHRPPLARSSTFRLIALLIVFVFGLATSVMTARWLGPYQKGTLSTLSFIGDAILPQVCLLGLGEAAIVLISQEKVTLQRAVSATVLPLLLFGVIGAALLFVVAVPAQWGGILWAVSIQAAILVVALYSRLFQDILNSREMFGTTSLITSLNFVVTAVLTAIILNVTEASLEGALIAGFGGIFVTLGGTARGLRRLGISFKPVWDAKYLIGAAKLGVGLQAAYLLVTMSQRADQVLVYSLSGPTAGGIYSVALTLGLLPGFVPMTLSHTTFPRLAHISEEEVWPLTALVVRIALIGGGLVGVFLAVLIPFLTPVVFGDDYSGSVAPALLLMVASLVWSVQWILARGWGARGRTKLLVTSFSVTSVTMLGLDLVLVPTWGLVGAAVGSIVATVCGLVVCIYAYHRRQVGFAVTALIPRLRDVSFLRGHVRELTGR